MATPGLTIQLAVGTDRDVPLRANDSSGDAATGLLGSDALSAVVWLGDDQEPLFEPTVAWVSAAGGTYTLTFAAADTADLGEGVYRLRVSITRASKTAPILEAWLNLTESAGLATAPAAYGTAKGVRRHLSNADRYSGNLAGFADELGQARIKLDQTILKKAPRSGGYTLGTIADGLVGAWGNTLGRDETLVDYLADDKLVQTPDVTDYCETYAAYLVVKGFVSIKPNDELKAKAAELYAEADLILANMTAEIDTNADGYGDINIFLGGIRSRYA